MSEEKYEYKLTAVVLVYNGMPYLRRCLTSLVNQTLDGLEIILINDVSTDDSLSICREFERDYENVRVIDKEINEGLATNANLGIQLARGEYVILVDNDDIIPVEAYEKLYAKAKENDADISVGKANFIVGSYQQEMNYHDNIGWKEEIVINDINEFPLLFHDAFYWNKIFRRKLLVDNDIKLPIGMIYADRLFSHTAYIHAKKISIIPDCVYLWRRHQTSLSMKREKIDNYINRLDSYDMNLDEIINHYPDYIKIILRRILLPIYGMLNDEEFEDIIFNRVNDFFEKASKNVENIYENNAEDIYNIYLYLIKNQKRAELKKLLELKLGEEKEVINENGKTYWKLPYFRDESVNIPDELFELHFLQGQFVNIGEIVSNNDTIIFNNIQIPKYFPLEEGYIVLKGKTRVYDVFEDNILYYKFERMEGDENLYRAEIPISDLAMFELYDVFIKSKHAERVANDFRIKKDSIDKIDNKNKNLQVIYTENGNLIVTTEKLNKELEVECTKEEIRLLVPKGKELVRIPKIYIMNDFTSEKAYMKLNEEETAFELKWKFFLDKSSTYTFNIIGFDNKGRMRNSKILNPAFIKDFKKASLKNSISPKIEVYKTKKGLKIRTK
ncbi:MAG: glycosyltransferase [archaeon]|nr:glycosyltransferase [archaeon]